MNLEGCAEDLQVTNVHGIYQTIDPKETYANQFYEGKVVFITGASGTIGGATATAYAKAGASVVLCGRNESTLEQVKEIISSITDHSKVVVVVADVVVPGQVERAVHTAVRTFGRIDIAIANAGRALRWEKPIAESDVDEWWNCVEVNLRGVYNVARYTLPHLIASKGYFIGLTTMGAQLRIPLSSAYNVSKHGVNRFIEFIQLEHPEVRSFALHPGAINTPLSLEAVRAQPKEVAEALEAQLVDSVDLPACTMMYLTSGKADWLCGRYVSSSWDLGEIAMKYREHILEKKLLVNRLSVV